MEGIKFDNLALRTLPIDPVEDNYVRTVSGACFSRVKILFNFEIQITHFKFQVKPTPVKNPELVAYSADALKLIDIDEEAAKVHHNQEYFSDFTCRFSL